MEAYVSEVEVIVECKEFKQFLGTRWLRSRLRVSSELAFNKMKETAKYGFVLMEIARYKNIHSCIRGFSLQGRHKDFNDEVTWMRQGVLLRRLACLEKDLFAKTVETLLSGKDGNIVIDDASKCIKSQQPRQATANQGRCHYIGSVGQAKEEGDLAL